MESTDNRAARERAPMNTSSWTDSPGKILKEYAYYQSLMRVETAVTNINKEIPVKSLLHIKCFT